MQNKLTGSNAGGNVGHLGVLSSKCYLLVSSCWKISAEWMYLSLYVSIYVVVVEEELFLQLNVDRGPFYKNVIFRNIMRVSTFSAMKHRESGSEAKGDVTIIILAKVYIRDNENRASAMIT